MTDLAVIMSVYQNDRLTFLKESVQSILDQTFSRFHYYITFDGPVCQDIDNYISSLKDDRLRLYRLEKNGGLANALNYLLNIVLENKDYQFIARMDADDISHLSRFQKQRDFLLNNTDISCVGCWYHEMDESGNNISDHKLPTDHESLKKRYLTRTPFAHPSVMYRRELIEKAGYYPTNTILMEDNVLWGKALKAGLKFSNISEYLFKFRIDKNFYKRRSGIKYGFNFILTKYKILNSNNAPVYAYLFTFVTGLLKMLHPSILKSVYKALRKT
jgi:glycosyltransferase involved in cell wall biosynthesis